VEFSKARSDQDTTGNQADVTICGSATE